ncbi:MAG: class I SAM-dependent methyltransferase [Bacteroidota bacterium]
MEKINRHFILEQYRSSLSSYTHLTTELGLWASERYVFQKYLTTTDHILDLGCGTGRTTFGLYKLGFHNILGVDLTPEMIASAQQLTHHFQSNIPFEVGDATQLRFPDEQYHAALFSFNGLMSIPSLAQRLKAFEDIYRVLRPGGHFIFTSHDRAKEASFLPFWKEEEIRWREGKQDPRLFEFGDLITISKNEQRTIFIHIPNQEEVKSCLQQTGFELVETFYRSERFDESDQVKASSGECRFWIAKK